ncbi:hypothetical protein B0H13DRAFT_2296875 [Mycena leptocephala]|nr:hypothetical protein B0H13DRAFT_2296875 [Mycena leptocephala]
MKYCPNWPMFCNLWVKGLASFLLGQKLLWFGAVTVENDVILSEMPNWWDKGAFRFAVCDCIQQTFDGSKGRAGIHRYPDTLLKTVHLGLQPDKINELSTHFVNMVGKASALKSPELRASQTRYQIQQGYNLLASTGLLPSPSPDLKRCVAALGHSLQLKANPKRLVQNWEIDEGDSDAEGEPEEDGTAYWTLGREYLDFCFFTYDGLIPINGAAPGPLFASSTGPTQVVGAPAPPRKSASTNLRRSVRIQQSRQDLLTKQIKTVNLLRRISGNVLRQLKSKCGQVPRFFGSSNVINIVSNLLPA